MIRYSFIQEAITLRHVEKREDHLVQKYVQARFDENKQLRNELNALKPEGLTASGRWAVRHIAVGVVMVAVLAAGGAYGHHVAASAAFREGMAQGHEDALKTEDRAMTRVVGR